MIPLRRLDSLEPPEAAGAHILHLAYLTRERIHEVGLGDWQRANEEISRRLLAAVSARPASVFFASSGIAARPQSDPYAEAKRWDEERFGAACAVAGVRLLAGRVFAVSGPYMTRARAFALGDLLLRALRGEELPVHSPHAVVRSYVSVLDLMAVAVAEALAPTGEHSEVFDVCGAEPVELGELATRIAALVGGRASERRIDHSLRADLYTGDPRRIAALAAAHGVVPASLDEQIVATAAWLAEAYPPS